MPTYALFIILAMVSPVVAWAAELDYPLAVATRDGRELFIADRNLPGVWRWDGTELKLYFQGSKKFRTPLNAVRCLAFDPDGTLLAGDSASRDVFRLSADAQPKPLTLIDTKVPLGEIGIPMALAVYPDGRILVSDLELQRLFVIPAAGGAPVEFAQIAAVRGLALDSQQRVWASTGGENAVVRFSADGKTRENIAPNRPLEFPHQIALADDNTAYVTDGYGKKLVRVTADGKIETVLAGDPLQNPVGLWWADGTAYIADPRAKQIFAVKPSGEWTAILPR